MKALLAYLKKHLRFVALGAAGLILLALGIRLSAGPLDADMLKPMITGRFEQALPHTRTQIGHIELAWFRQSNALGLRISEIEIHDAKGRVIASAQTLDVALAVDSLLFGHMAPARLSAQDFFIAASVSDKGRYDLGYEASGQPGDMPPLETLFRDITGKESLGSPASYVRQMRLGNGRVAFSQPSTGLNWEAEVRSLRFSKLNKKLSAELDMTVHANGRSSLVSARAEGVTGLSSATFTADVRDMVPADVFPNAGAASGLAVLSAPVSGQVRLTYSDPVGIDRAHFDIAAGEGQLVLRDYKTPLHGARINADYDPQSRSIRFKTLQVRADHLDTDLSGEVRLVARPDDQPGVDLAFDFTGRRVTGRLARDFPVQSVSNVHVRGLARPLDRELAIEELSGDLDGTPLEGAGRLYTDETGRLGADLWAKLKGHFSKEEVFAFWPEFLAPIVRTDLIERIKGGDYANADFVLKAPPGHFEPGGLRDDSLKLTFDFRDVSLSIEDRMAPATELAGSAVLKGNSFAMDVTGGRLLDVHLNRGGLVVPQFRKGNSRTHIWMEGETPPGPVIAAVDPLTDGALKRLRLDERLSGNAEVRVDIRFPTFHAITNQTLDITFSADINNAGLTQAALGWDMSEGSVHVEGNLLADTLVVSGWSRLGPYEGDFTYRTQLDPKVQIVTIDGRFDASPFGGSPQVPVALVGDFVLKGPEGEGRIHSDILKGDIRWSGKTRGDERPTQLIIDGHLLRAGFQAQGLPIFDRLKHEVPTTISLARSGDIWSGTFDAEALTGNIAYLQGARPRLVYQSTITPSEATELGFGGLPLFRQPRNLTVNVNLDEGANEALIRVDQIDATLGWSETRDGGLLRRLTLNMQPQDWTIMGLPADTFRPRKDVEVVALWQQHADAISGTVSVADHPFHFSMPVRHGHGSYNASAESDYTLKVTSRLDTQVLDLLGYTHDPLRIAGSLDMIVRLYDRSDKGAFDIELDAQAAELSLAKSQWIKRPDEPALIEITASEAIGGVTQLSRVYAKGTGLHIEGRVGLDASGKVTTAELPRLLLDGLIDGALVLRSQTGGGQALTLRGNSLDLRQWVKSTTTRAQMAGKGRPQPFAIDIDMAQIYLSEAPLKDVQARLNWDGENRIAGVASASLPEGHQARLTFVPEQDHSRFVMTTDNLGGLLLATTSVTQIEGGTFEVEGLYANGQIDATLKGEDLRARGVPFLAQLLTVASLEGLSNTLSGDGIAFSDYEFPARYKNGLLFVRNGWAKGGALGFNIWGTADLRTKALDLSGTLIPAYTFNGLFGDVGKDGLGLVGLQYNVTGDYSAPQAYVNPLTVMLPGFIRRLAKVDRPDPIPPLTLSEQEGLDRAIHAAAAQEGPSQP